MKQKLLKVFKDDEATKFASIINDINQIMKTTKKTNTYTIVNGVSYSFKSAYEDLIHQKLEFDITSNRNKKAYQEYISFINGYLNGKELFDWLKDNKKYINEVILYNDSFRINTINKSTFFQTESLTDKEILKRDYTSFNKYIKRTNKVTDFIYEEENFEEQINEINLENLIIPYEIRFKVPTNKKNKKKVIKFRITKRIFPTFKKDSQIKLYIRSIDSKNKVYNIEYEIINKTSRLYNYATIINY